MLTEGERADFLRSIEMIRDAVAFAQTHFEKGAESMAAQHCSSKVMYPPVVTLLDQARFKLEAMENVLAGEEE